VLLVLGFTVPAAAQTDLESEQDAESGESDESAEVLNEGDNSNQCVGVQPVSNTGNAITDLDIILQLPTGEQEIRRHDTQAFLDLIDELDLDLEDIGSTIELDPEQAVECAQAVDQAATASDYSDYWSAYWDAYWSWYYGY
jgi:hypothetical protein